MDSNLSRRKFIASGMYLLGGVSAGLPSGMQADLNIIESKPISASPVKFPFGDRRIYYNNFAEHLQNVYNPNMVYPDLPNRWSDEDWRNLIDMIAGFGFNTFEFWLVPPFIFNRRDFF